MDRTDLLAALCLVLVIEGLILLVAPGVWKRMAAQLANTPERALRVGGGVMIVAGLLALQLVR
jgi:uncharacterized protein YjeT (DUF2065 family)